MGLSSALDKLDRPTVARSADRGVVWRAHIATDSSELKSGQWRPAESGRNGPMVPWTRLESCEMPIRSPLDASFSLCGWVGCANVARGAGPQCSVDVACSPRAISGSSAL